MKTTHSIITSGILLGAAPFGYATVIGFGQLGGSNTAVPANLGSNATVAAAGVVVTNGVTPNIALNWDANWDIHTSPFFAPLEDLTVGGGAWDNEGGGPRIGQLDIGNHTIGFNADPGFSLVLNSFDFAHTAETAGTTAWHLSLTDSSLATVWETTVQFTNGNAVTIFPNFTGSSGEDYILHFDRTASSYTSDGRHGIDNLSFSQVPEPGAVGLASIAGLVLAARRRRFGKLDI